MRRLTLSLVALLLLALSVIPAVAQRGNIVEVASAEEDFSILVQAVEAAGLVDALSGDQPLTVLAPTNDAFTRLASSFEFELDALLADTELLNDLLLYHVLEGPQFSNLIIQLIEESGNDEIIVPTLLEGSAVGFSINDEGALRVNRVATVVAPDIGVSNGVIHGIDNVVFPLSLQERIAALSDAGPVEGTSETSIYGIAANTPDEFNILADAIEASENVDLLDRGFPFTAFAPTDAAFEALFGELGLSAEDALAQPELLNTILRYHLLDGEFTSEDVAGLDGQEVETLQGETITVSVTEDGVVLNDGVNVVETDIEADNGIIHVVDAVLVPDQALDQLERINLSATSIAGIARDAEGLTILEEVVIASGNSGLLDRGFPFTVFAPTDEAFEALFEELGLTAEEALDQPELLDVILRYHILEQEVPAETALTLDGAEVETLLGETITITVTEMDPAEMEAEEAAEGEEGAEGEEAEMDAEATEEPMMEGPVQVVMLNDTATVIETDIMADNGVVHLIDTVLVPEAAGELLEVINLSPTSIAGIARDGESFTILEEAIIATDSLQLLDQGFPFTVFAPTDEAFTALFDELGISQTRALQMPELLNVVLRYHILEEELSAEDLIAAAPAEYETIQGETLSVAVDGDSVVINDSVTVAMADVGADNGVVHVVDAVLVPQAAVDMLAPPEEEMEMDAEATEEADMEEDMDAEATEEADMEEDMDAEATEEADMEEDMDAEATEEADMEEDMDAEATEEADMEEDMDAEATEEADMEEDMDAEATEEADMEEDMDAEATEEADMEEDMDAEATEEAAAGTIADIVAGDENFSILLQVAEATGNAETLATGGPFTVFAPTDEAFETLLAAIGVDAPTALALPELLEPMLLYHVVEGEVPAEAVLELDGEEVETLQGETITVTITEDGDVVLTSALGEVMVTMTDIMAENGIVHVVDAVLVPQETIDALSQLGVELGG